MLESYGGIEYYLDDLLSCAVELYGPENVTALVPRRKSRMETITFRYPVSVVPFSRNFLLGTIENRFSWNYFQAAKRLIKTFKPTLLLCGHVSLAPTVHLLSRQTGVPYLSCAYGLECWGDLWPQDDFAFRRSKGILSISQWTKHILLERGYPASGIRIVHPIMAPEFEKIPAPQGKAPERPFTLLTVSRLDASEQYKGQDHVLEALHRLRLTNDKIKVRYIIQGDGDDLPRLQRLAREFNVLDWVEFHPKVTDRKALAETYRSADLFVMPSRFGRWDKKWRGEGFGIVYVEAAAFGVPSVAYACGGATDIIIDGTTGWLVDPDNIAELARLIEELMEKRTLIQEAGQKAYRHVMDHFTHRKMKEQLKNALADY